MGRRQAQGGGRGEAKISFSYDDCSNRIAGRSKSKRFGLRWLVISHMRLQADKSARAFSAVASTAAYASDATSGASVVVTMVNVLSYAVTG